MIKLDIINNVSEKTGVSKMKAETAVEALFEAMKDAMRRGERIGEAADLDEEIKRVVADIVEQHGIARGRGGGGGDFLRRVNRGTELNDLRAHR